MAARRSDSGAALLAALILTSLLTTIAAVLVFMTTTETLTSANYRTAAETSYAAEAGIERTIADVRALADWTPLVSGAVTSRFDDGAGTPAGPDGRPLDLALLTARRQASSDALHAGPDAPRWRLFAHAPLSQLLPPGSIATPAYLVVWVADDPGDGDGDPARDANGVLMVTAQAFGTRGAQRSSEVTVARTPIGVRLSAWRLDP